MDNAPQQSDDCLVERARKDPSAFNGAFTILYERYLPQIYRYLYFKVSSPADAEDLTAQVFLAALEGLPGYHFAGSFRGWLFGIARRKAADFYRKGVPQARLEQAANFPIPTESPLALVAQTETLRSLIGLIAHLDEDDQELLRLRFAAGLGFAEIAGLTRRKESAVKMALYRLLDRLEHQMEDANSD